ncbi:MAG: DUF1330 domain-containing protein [bacterium]
MSVYYIGAYDIIDAESFKRYPPLVAALLPKYGGEVLASDTNGLAIEGEPRKMNAIVKFPSKEAVLGFYNDPAYEEAKRIRQQSATNITMVIVEEFGK